MYPLSYSLCLSLPLSLSLSASAALASVLLAVAQVSANAKCENIYKDFSDCVLELGDSMDNQDENVTSTKGVEAVCRYLTTATLVR